ncbi:MAG: sulfite exporter TauE/SafE family protein [Clostridiales bacterium]|nr:sulfite exporter TauE/SafE family protein [Clostridiales bacterium]
MRNIKIILIAIIAGIINGMFSTGAGLILVPALIYILKDDEYTARGTTLFIILILTIVNIFIYSSNQAIDLDIVYIIIGGIIGNTIGNKLVYKINRNILSIMFAIFTIIMGIGMIK